MQDVSQAVIKAAGVRKIDQVIVSPLFAASEQGVWYDPSDLTTLFQDSAGTTPVTAAGQPVGRILDKSGRNNHATQSTAAARPTYGLHPITGIRNLLSYTEQFDNSYWLKATSGTGTLPVVTSNFDLAPDGSLTADRVQLDSGVAGNSQVANSNFTTPNVVGASYTFSIWMRSLSGSPLVTMFSNAQTQNVTVTPTWQRFTFTQTASLAADTVRLSKRDIWSSAGSADILVWGAQYESGSVATIYQRVVSQFEVTETGVAPVYYLSFDGVDDSMVTPTLTPAIDKAQIFAGMRKLSDTGSFPILAELSVATTTNNGVIMLSGRSSGSVGMLFQSKGTTVAGSNISTAASPVTQVLTGIGDIAAPLARLRSNQVDGPAIITTQGTGNYLAYPMYIGRRAGTGTALNFNLYSLITRFGANLTTDQITSIETWVNAKTGAY